MKGYKIECNQGDAPNTIYDEKWKANRWARNHKRQNPSHNVTVLEIEVSFTVSSQFQI